VRVQIVPATRRGLRERGTWRYPPPFDVYDDDGKPVKNPERFFEARDDTGELVGFYYFERKGRTVKFGLGLRPDLTGRGLGVEFVSAGMEFARGHYGAERMVLEVFSFNERAVRVYERVGFRTTGRRMQVYRDRELETVDMEAQL
jgi:ribosomal-protein-alanine N-acetyltransferase